LTIWITLGVLLILALFLDIPLSTWAHSSGLAPWLKARALLTHLIRFPGNFLEYTLPICLVVLIAKVAVRSEAEELRNILGNTSPSPGTPGEGGGEGLQQSESLENCGGFECPHPGPLPEYRERGKESSYRKGHALVANSNFWTAPAIVLLAGIFSGINSLLKWMIGRIRPYHGVPAFELHPFSRRLLDAEAGFSFPSGDASLAFAMAMSLTLVLPRFWPIWWTLAIIVGLERIAENAHYPSDVAAGAALGIGVALIANWFVRTLCQRISNKEQETSIPS
jgi:hypothetical protein